MASSAASSVDAYLAELPDDRRAEIGAVRDVIRTHLPAGYVEAVGYGVISYHIPLSRYPNTYNKQPLTYVGLAAQKNYNALYLMCSYMNDPILKRLQLAFKAKGTKLDMGKACIRFKSASDLPLDVIGQIVSEFPSERWIEIYEASRLMTAAGKKKATRKA